MKKFLANTVVNRNFRNYILEYNNANNVKSSLRIPFGSSASGSALWWDRSGAISTFQSAPQVNNSPSRWLKAPAGNTHAFDGFFEIRARVDSAVLNGGASFTVFGESPAVGVFSSWKPFDGSIGQHQVVLTIGSTNVNSQVLGIAEIRYRDFPTIVLTRGFENYVLFF